MIVYHPHADSQDRIAITHDNGVLAWRIQVEDDGSLNIMCLENKDSRLCGISVKPLAGNVVSVRQQVEH